MRAKGPAFSGREYRHEEPDRTVHRAPVVAKKPGNAGGTNRTERVRQTEPSGVTKAAQAGAKGCRKVETQ